MAEMTPAVQQAYSLFARTAENLTSCYESVDSENQLRACGQELTPGLYAADALAQGISGPLLFRKRTRPFYAKLAEGGALVDRARDGNDRFRPYEGVVDQSTQYPPTDLCDGKFADYLAGAITDVSAGREKYVEAKTMLEGAPPGTYTERERLTVESLTSSSDQMIQVMRNMATRQRLVCMSNQEQRAMRDV